MPSLMHSGLASGVLVHCARLPRLNAAQAGMGRVCVLLHACEVTSSPRPGRKARPLPVLWCACRPPHGQKGDQLAALNAQYASAIGLKGSSAAKAFRGALVGFSSARRRVFSEPADHFLGSLKIAQPPRPKRSTFALPASIAVCEIEPTGFRLYCQPLGQLDNAWGFGAANHAPPRTTPMRPTNPVSQSRPQLSDTPSLLKLRCTWKFNAAAVDASL